MAAIEGCPVSGVIMAIEGSKQESTGEFEAPNDPLVAMGGLEDTAHQQ